MLTPEQLQNLPQELTDLYDQLSEFILRDIARRIAKGAEITDTAEYKLYRAKSLGLSTDEIAAKIAEINGSSASEINRLSVRLRRSPMSSTAKCSESTRARLFRWKKTHSSRSSFPRR